MNDLALLDFIYLALKDIHVEDQESLIDITCKYGKRYGVTPEEVKKALSKRLVDFLNDKGRKI